MDGGRALEGGAPETGAETAITVVVVVAKEELVSYWDFNLD